MARLLLLECLNLRIVDFCFPLTFVLSTLLASSSENIVPSLDTSQGD